MNAPLSRRSTLGLLSTALLAACGRNNDKSTLRVGSQKGATKSLMLSSGALEGAPYTIEWSEFPAGQNLIEAIASDAVDLGSMSDAPFQFAYQSGSPIKVVSARSTQPRPREVSVVLVPPASHVRTIKDLVGKRLATTRGSSGHYLTLRALAVAGLSPRAIQFVFLAPGDAKAAFSSGSVDAWATWLPYLVQAIRDGARVVVDGQDYTASYGFLISNERAVATKSALLRDFVAREAKALAWAHKHMGDYARVLAGETGLPFDIARILAEKTTGSPVPLDDRILQGQKLVLETFRNAGAIKITRPTDQIFAKI